jgi:transposase InsO family protein
VAPSPVGRRPADGTEGAPQHRALSHGGSRHRGAAGAGATAAGRCLHRTQGRDPTADALVAAPLPATPRDQPPAQGYFHIDIAELRYEGGKAFLYVAVDRTSKLVFARIYRNATKLAAAGFLKSLVRTVPYRIHTVLTDNGVQFVQLQRGQSRSYLIHIFERVCLENGIEHRLTKPYHPWTNGQAERMVRTIKEATVKSFHYASIQELRRHVSDWLIAYNFAKQLKALKFRTPYEAIAELWKSKPDVFIVKPTHHMLGPNT